MDRKITNQSKTTSYITGVQYFIRANAVLFFLLLLMIINIKCWGAEEYGTLGMIIFPAELLILSLSLFTWFRPAKRKKYEDRVFSKNKLIAFLIAITFISVFSLIFIGVNLPFPTTILMLFLVMNGMASLYSIFFHKVIIVLYESIVFNVSGSITSYIFKYIVVTYLGLTYYVQIALSRMLLPVNKVFTFLFLLLLIWQSFILLTYF
ncbi:hypothetical protein [Virgibacillus halodenitrificans]|uniref:hypothetical protein n=1 Tax=Virgibacillus halodenitrificans TaxID=1482 RepID=UPI000EF549EE|nr:hypothetical protein [Virgibacillus halodenitrificans]